MTQPHSGSGKPVALETREQAADGRRFSPSAGRNRDVIRDVFLSHMPREGDILEIASGTGEHGAHIITDEVTLRWHYSDIDRQSLISQSAWATHEPHDRLLGPHRVDTTSDHWGTAEDAAPFVGMACMNMIHIAPFAAAEGLIAGAGRILSPGGRLFVYGPFARGGKIAPSNQRFNEDLKRRDPNWGVRDLDLEIAPLAVRAGLSLAQIIDMPANNLSVIFERS